MNNADKNIIQGQAYWKKKKFEDRLCDITEKLSIMDEKLLNFQWHTIRENLIFSGIPETLTQHIEQEDCETRIRQFIREEMRINRPMAFERVQRLGRYKSGQSRPQPIVAKFTYFKGMEIVRQEAPKVLIDTK